MVSRIVKSSQATEDNLRLDRKDNMILVFHAGIEPRNIPMSETQGEKGIDVYMAWDTPNRLDEKIDEVYWTGDGDFVPLVRALMKNESELWLLISNFKKATKIEFCQRKTF